MPRDVTVVDAQAAHIGPLAADLRAGYVVALRRVGLTPERAIWRRYRSSVLRRTGLVDGRVAAMWGVAPAGGDSLLGGEGDGWLFTAEAVRLAPKAALRIGRGELERFRAVFGRMRGIVSLEDECAERFAERLGCRLLGAEGAFFRRYEVD